MKYKSVTFAASVYKSDLIKCLYSPQGFCSVGISLMCKKVLNEKKWVLTFSHPNDIHEKNSVLS